MEAPKHQRSTQHRKGKIVLEPPQHGVGCSHSQHRQVGRAINKHSAKVLTIPETGSSRQHAYIIPRRSFHQRPNHRSITLGVLQRCDYTHISSSISNTDHTLGRRAPPPQAYQGMAGISHTRQLACQNTFHFLNALLAGCSSSCLWSWLKRKRSWAQGHTPVILALWERETGRSL